jgi:hypothetical protein
VPTGHTKKRTRRRALAAACEWEKESADIK